MKKSITLFCTAVSLCLCAQNSVVFTNNGNFTVPSGINSLTIEVVGAGGNGGGNGGGGGGGGGYAKGVYNVVPGTVYNIVVGVPGSGPAAGTAPRSPGRPSPDGCPTRTTPRRPGAAADSRTMLSWSMRFAT